MRANTADASLPTARQRTIRGSSTILTGRDALKNNHLVSLSKASSYQGLDTLELPPHFFAAVLAYTKLEVLKLKCGIGHFRLKAQLYTVGLKAMYHQLTGRVLDVKMVKRRNGI